ncbi:methylenetetrahydrofolate--tRNA-(uracil(54)-C(5))-methyltransferase (FADH(2)-oxidizing) TrmFO [bacterium]|nr:methylenetetrahydrofolate--tRNA-(uracil(54)-C(5))-methyltransferase (FADH(2)-oxidizing) TrmFO [bacterium]
MKNKVKIIGGGLAGCEAAYQLLKRGIVVELYEMRPKVSTPAHTTGNLAELVCSNSLKSTDINTAQGLLKQELSMLDSLILRVAKEHSVPAGGALAVEREAFSLAVERELSRFPNLKIIREECTKIAPYSIIATGPLTSDAMSKEITNFLGEESLSFYDAVAPIVNSESVDMNSAFFAGRYNKGGDDYINCPMNEKEYYDFVDNLILADKIILKDFLF